MRYRPAEDEHPIASVTSGWSPEHGTWTLARYDYATERREVVAVHPRRLAPYERGTLQLWLDEQVKDLKIGAWTALTDVYGYYETACVYA
jgi:hypothetical protein